MCQKIFYSLNWIKCSVQVWCDRFYDGGPFLFGKSLPNISYREKESLAWHIFRSIIKLMKQMTNDLRRRPISCYSWVEKQTQCCIINAFIAQSSLNIFAQKYLHKCKDTYFILQNRYLSIFQDSFGAKLLRDDCDLSSFSFVYFRFRKHNFGIYLFLFFWKKKSIF